MCYQLLQELHVYQAPSGLGVLVVLPPQKASNAGGWGRGSPPHRYQVQPGYGLAEGKIQGSNPPTHTLSPTPHPTPQS